MVYTQVTDIYHLKYQKLFLVTRKKVFDLLKNLKKKNIKSRYQNECYVNRESYSKNLYKQKIYLKLGFLNSQFFQEVKKKKLLGLFPKFTIKISQMNWSENRMGLLLLWLSLPEFQLNMKYWVNFISTDRLGYKN